MADTDKSIAFTGGGQPAGQVSKEEPGTQSAQYVTREEAARMAQEAAEAAYRKAQSLFDKGRDGLIKETRSQLQALEQAVNLQKKAGIEVPDDKLQAMRNEIVTRALMATPDESNPQPIPSQPSQQPVNERAEVIDPITAEAWRMMKAAGVELEESDPETAQLDQTSPVAFLKSVEQGIQAKKARLATQQQQPGRAPTSVGSSGAGTSLESQYREELSKVRGAEQVARLKQKYRQMGLKVY